MDEVDEADDVEEAMLVSVLDVIVEDDADPVEVTKVNEIDRDEEAAMLDEMETVEIAADIVDDPESVADPEYVNDSEYADEAGKLVESGGAVDSDKVVETEDCFEPDSVIDSRKVEEADSVAGSKYASNLLNVIDSNDSNDVEESGLIAEFEKLAETVSITEEEETEGKSRKVEVVETTSK